jgi:hypothetical protein
VSLPRSCTERKACNDIAQRANAGALPGVSLVK